MKCFTTAILLAALIGVIGGLAAAGLAAAGPIMMNGGPNPDPAELSRCAGTSGAYVALSDEPASPLSPAPSAMAASATSTDAGGAPSTLSIAPIMQNGGPTPSPMAQAARSRSGWCGGQYRPDAGTNFSGS
jgi:hypothetical protein